MSKPTLVCWRVSSKEFGNSKLGFTFYTIYNYQVLTIWTHLGDASDCSQRYVMPAGGNYVSEKILPF